MFSVQVHIRLAKWNKLFRAKFWNMAYDIYIANTERMYKLGYTYIHGLARYLALSTVREQHVCSHPIRWAIFLPNVNASALLIVALFWNSKICLRENSAQRYWQSRVCILLLFTHNVHYSRVCTCSIFIAHGVFIEIFMRQLCASATRAISSAWNFEYSKYILHC